MNLQEYFEDRDRLFLMGAVDADMLESFNRQEAEYLAKPEEERRPLVIVISSAGGENGPARALHERIRMLASVMPVSIVAVGDCASAGVTIFLAIEKSARFTTRDTEFMIHQISIDEIEIAPAPISGRRLQKQEVDFSHHGHELYQKWLISLIAKQCGRRRKDIRRLLDPGAYFVGQEAVDFGLASKVLI